VCVCVRVCVLSCIAASLFNKQLDCRLLAFTLAVRVWE